MDDDNDEHYGDEHENPEGDEDDGHRMLDDPEEDDTKLRKGSDDGVSSELDLEEILTKLK